jgi:hypothetical protein
MPAISRPATVALIEALQILGADSGTQRSILPKNIAKADEIALILHDAVLLMVQEADRERIPKDALSAAVAIDDFLGSMSGNSQGDFWSEDALKNDLRWHRVRLEARRILRSLSAPLGPPVVRGEYVVGARRNTGEES